MRAILVSMIAGAGLLVTACGGGTTATVNNTTVEDVATENVTVSDDMTGGTDAANATENSSIVTSNTTMTESTSNAM